MNFICFYLLRVLGEGSVLHPEENVISLRSSHSEVLSKMFVEVFFQKIQNIA